MTMASVGRASVPFVFVLGGSRNLGLGVYGKVGAQERRNTVSKFLAQKPGANNLG